MKIYRPAVKCECLPPMPEESLLCWGEKWLRLTWVQNHTSCVQCRSSGCCTAIPSNRHWRLSQHFWTVIGRDQQNSQHLLALILHGNGMKLRMSYFNQNMEGKGSVYDWPSCYDTFVSLTELCCYWRSKPCHDANMTSNATKPATRTRQTWGMALWHLRDGMKESQWLPEAFCEKEQRLRAADRKHQKRDKGSQCVTTVNRYVMRHGWI